MPAPMSAGGGTISSVSRIEADPRYLPDGLRLNWQPFHVRAVQQKQQ
jgi:hypothetical protein